MFKKLLSLAVVALALQPVAQAQITLETGDFPQVGDTFVIGRDYSPSTELGGPADTAQAWDFSEISPVFFIDTARYFDATTGAGFTNFSSAELYSDFETNSPLGTVELYFDKTNSGIAIMGFYSIALAGFGADGAVPFTPGDTFLNNENTQGDSSYQTTLGKIGLAFDLDDNPETMDTFELNTYATRVFDAWGELTTPFNTYDVLRRRVTLINADSIAGTKPATIPTDPDTVTKTESRRDTSYTIEFYTNGIGNPLLTVFTDATFTAVDSVDFVVGALANFNITPATRTFVDTLNFIDNSTGTPSSWAWEFGDGDTSNTQNNKHKYAAPGDYLVSLTVANDFGSNTRSKLVNVPDTTATGISTVKVLSEVVAYPNPAKEFVNIQPINTNLTDAVEVFDATGKMVLRQNTNNAAVIRVETSSLTNGVYIFNVYNNGNLTNRGKFTVQK
jgi:PKD repeat protein